MRYMTIEININNDAFLTAEDMEMIDKEMALGKVEPAIKEQLPDLPKGAHWSVHY